MEQNLERHHQHGSEANGAGSVIDVQAALCNLRCISLGWSTRQIFGYTRIYRTNYTLGSFLVRFTCHILKYTFNHWVLNILLNLTQHLARTLYLKALAYIENLVRHDM